MLILSEGTYCGSPDKVRSNRWRVKFCTSIYWGPVCVHEKKLPRAGVSPMEKKKIALERTTCPADKTNHPVERLSLNRSQCGSCSTKYDTSAGT